jgi:predicted NAD/FAD-binding protein
MNILQRLDAPVPFLVTLNHGDAIDPRRIIRRINYHHPLYTPASVDAQARHREIDGARATYYCGAWLRNGFHEDGVVSALEALQHFRDDHAQRSLYRTA